MAKKGGFLSLLVGGGWSYNWFDMFLTGLKKVVEGDSLSRKEAFQTMGDVMEGRVSPTLLASFLTALRIKGETVEEILGSAEAMRKRVVSVKTGRLQTVLDTCGTGGDGKGTFNFSTMSAIVASACDVPVAKHGNRAASSKCGSSDLLSELGVAVDLDKRQAERSLQKNGITYMHAPAFHPAMKFAGPVRKELGFRTIFNLLGPLSNPASASVHTIGVFHPDLVDLFARVLKGLGVRSAFTFHGAGGLDEVSLLGPTRAARLRGGKITRVTFTPSSGGLKKARLKDLLGGTPKMNAEIARKLLRGKKNAYRDGVCLSVGVALVAAEREKSVRAGVKRAQDAIDSEKALRKFESWAEWTRKA